jgi:3-hydroxyacyl-CoA dehydrogenase / 3-hydroxy-2-methylbutyryl-CoA dehydrogenase
VKIADAHVVVTGGASGLGEGVARMIVAGGGSVTVLDRVDSKGPELVAELGASATFVPVDVTDAAGLESAMRVAREALGRIDAVVCSAGVSPTARVVSRRRELFPLQRFRFALDVNLVGTFDAVRHAAGHMADNAPSDEGERGVVVMIGSIAAFEGQVGQAAYAASKGGVVAMTLPLARDLAEWGIRVMSICPGTIDTPMVQAAPEAVRESLRAANVFPGRLGRPDDVAAVVRLCLEDTYLNGEVIRVDAGVRLAPR